MAGIVGQTTKGVTACYNTSGITGAGNYVAGIVAFASGASASVKNCYNRAYVESPSGNVGAVVGMTNNASICDVQSVLPELHLRPGYRRRQEYRSDGYC